MMCYNGKSKIDIYVKDKWKKVEIIKTHKNQNNVFLEVWTWLW